MVYHNKYNIYNAYVYNMYIYNIAVGIAQLNTFNLIKHLILLYN